MSGLDPSLVTSAIPGTNSQSDNMLQSEEKHPSKNSFKDKFATNEFRNNKNFFDVFVSLVDDAINLNISTSVKSGDSTSEIATKINLLDGDIINEFGVEFLTNADYKELQTFHKEQVAKGEEIIKKNLESLKDLVTYAINIYQQSEKIKK